MNVRALAAWFGWRGRAPNTREANMTTDVTKDTPGARVARLVDVIAAVDGELAALEDVGGEVPSSTMHALITAEAPAVLRAQLDDAATALVARDARRRVLQTVRERLERERGRAELDAAVARMSAIVTAQTAVARELATALSQFHAAAKLLVDPMQRLAEIEARADALVNEGLAAHSRVRDLIRRTGASDVTVPELSDAVDRVMEGLSCSAFVSAAAVRLESGFEPAKARAGADAGDWARGIR
jgi:hypothetical protein